MSSYQNVSSDGTTVTLGLSGNPAISYTSSGAQFTKNKLINGEVTRINQRGFNGTWSGKSVWETQPATIAGKEAAYGYDMWFRSNAARSDGTGANENMAQWIEAGNFRPSTVHTLSGTGVTTTQITSPASGDWKIVVAQGATNVQVEEGSVQTPLELRSIRYELAECQRYLRAYSGTDYLCAVGSTGFYGDVNGASLIAMNSEKMRVRVPAVVTVGTQGTDWAVSTSGGVYQTGFTLSAGSYGGVIHANKASHGLSPSNLFLTTQANGIILMSAVI